VACCKLQHSWKPEICKEAGCSLTMPVFERAARFYELIR